MIWVGAALVGVILALVLIPWPDLMIDSSDQTSTVTTPRDRAGADVVGDPSPQADPTPIAAPVTPTPDIGLPSDAVPVPGGPGDADEPVNWVNPAREARNERLRQPDMVLVRTAESRWRSLIRTIDGLPHDGAGDHTMGRIEELRADLAAYRRSPNEYNMDELIDRQRNILSELKQTSYWTPEIQETEAQLTQAIETYTAESTADP